MIYTALHQLAESGLVAFRTERHEGRARKVYSLTDAERRAFESWLAEPPESDVMFSDLVAFKVAAQTNENIDASKEWMRTTIGRLKHQIAEHQANLEEQIARTEFSRMAIEYGIDMLRLRVQLLERAVARGSPEARGAASSSDDVGAPIVKAIAATEVDSGGQVGDGVRDEQ